MSLSISLCCCCWFCSWFTKCLLFVHMPFFFWCVSVLCNSVEKRDAFLFVKLCYSLYPDIALGSVCQLLLLASCCSSHISVNCVLECCRQGICTASAFIIPRLRVAYARDILLVMYVCLFVCNVTILSHVSHGSITFNFSRWPTFV